MVTEERYLALDVPDALAFRRIDRILVQGKSQPVVLYEVLEADESSQVRGQATCATGFRSGPILL